MNRWTSDASHALEVWAQDHFMSVGLTAVSNHCPCLVLVCSVFWDLYCAAPDRRETCEHSSEAKAFHDYVSEISQLTVCVQRTHTHTHSLTPIASMFNV